MRRAELQTPPATLAILSGVRSYGFTSTTLSKKLFAQPFQARIPGPFVLIVQFLEVCLLEHIPVAALCRLTGPLCSNYDTNDSNKMLQLCLCFTVVFQSCNALCGVGGGKDFHSVGRETGFPRLRKLYNAR